MDKLKQQWRGLHPITRGLAIFLVVYGLLWVGAAIEAGSLSPLDE